MRRHAIRLVLAVLATSALAACADLPTGPKSPTAPRFDGGAPTGSSSDTTKRTSTQGSNI